MFLWNNRLNGLVFSAIVSHCWTVFPGGGACNREQEKRVKSTQTRALYTRSVCVPWVVFHGLACHPWPCMLLKVRFVADSIPSALTILFNGLQHKCPHGSTLDVVLKRLDLAHIGSKRTAHLRHTQKIS